MKRKAKIVAVASAAGLLSGAIGLRPATAHAFDRVVDGRGHILDNRYNHGHYYPGIGVSVRVLPEGYRPYFFAGHPYYFFGGVCMRRRLQASWS